MIILKFVLCIFIVLFGNQSSDTIAFDGESGRNTNEREIFVEADAILSENIGGYDSFSTDEDWDVECEDIPASSEIEIDDPAIASDNSSSSAHDSCSDKNGNEVAWNDKDYYASDSDDNDIDSVPNFLRNGKWFSYQEDGTIKLEEGLMFENKPRFLSVLQ